MAMTPADILTNHEYTVIAVEGNFEDFRDVHNWCIEQFGQPGSRWFSRPGKFYFRDAKDAFWFELAT